ncbi:hypothetical protein BKA83DRAFT_290171 [Pisolithus microcarpus]|nr:hypothetical protein BKA83DRAFT_290171 [Pisolithus microcarpus]
MRRPVQSGSRVFIVTSDAGKLCMKVLSNGFPFRRVAGWRIVQLFRNPGNPVHAFRIIGCLVAIDSLKSTASACPGGSLVTRLSAHSPPPPMGFETKQSYKVKASGTTHQTSRIKKKKEI